MGLSPRKRCRLFSLYKLKQWHQSLDPWLVETERYLYIIHQNIASTNCEWKGDRITRYDSTNLQRQGGIILLRDALRLQGDETRVFIGLSQAQEEFFHEASGWVRLRQDGTVTLPQPPEPRFIQSHFGDPTPSRVCEEGEGSAEAARPPPSAPPQLSFPC